MAEEFIEVSEEEFLGEPPSGTEEFIEISDEEFNAPGEEVGTSFSKEVSQLGPAFKESLGRPLENMGEGFEVVGFQGVANALKGAITEPENYVSAAERFMEPQPGESQFLGFAWQYAPRAAVEQAGQAIGSIATRIAGGIAGAPLGPAGVATGAFVGPAIFEAAQIIGPVAKERAKNSGREVPTNQDIVAATITAAGSGALNAIGAKYLPGGEKATGKFFKRVASSFVGEGVTETGQAVTEQVGSTAGTEAGLNINVKQALGEGIIGGTTAAGLQAITYPLTKEPKNQVIRTPEQAEEIDIQAKSNEEAVSLMGQPADQDKNELISRVNEIEKVVANNETLINSLEPNDETRTQLELENKIAKQEAGRLKGELEKSVGLAPIPTAEQQQVELAKQIAAPVEPAPTTPAPLPEAAPAPITPAEEAKPKAPPKYSPEGLAALTDAELASEEQSLALSVNREAVADPQSELASLYQGALDLVRAEKSRREAATVTKAPAVTPAPTAGVEPVITEKVDDVVGEVERSSEQQSNTVKVFRGVAEAGNIPTGGTFFTDSEKDASAYAQLAALRQEIDRNEELNELVSEIMAEESAEDVTDLSISTIKSIIEGNNIKVGDISEGAVLRGNINLGNVLNLESFGSEIGSLPETWNELNKLGLVPETWESLDEDTQFDLQDKYRGKAFYSLLEGEVNLNDQFEKGIDTVVFTDQNTEGKGTHRTYLTKAAEQFTQEATPAEAAPVGIAVGSRIKLGKSPQTYTVEQVIPQSETERGLGEQFYSVKNERTGEVQTVESKDLKPVLARVRRGEKGGVLFLTREDFIQAGQNIYEAGMEFATWARQMVQRFGDAVRQFLGDIWQAVSGIPAKVNELAGFLPGKGEAGAVAFGRGEEPPKPPKKPAEPAAAPEKPAPERKQVAGLKFGAPKTTPIGINKKTEEIVQKQIFNGSITPSPENTAQAYELIERLLDPRDGGKFADEINETTRSQMEEGEKRKVDETIGAVKLGNELFKYAVNLAAKGDLRMLQLLFERANDFATSGTATISTDARNLQARANLASWVRRAAEAQKKGVVNSVAIQIFGPSVTKEQMDSIIAALNAVNKTKTAEAEQIYDDLETTGEKAGVDIRSAVERAIQKADPTTRDPWVMALEILKAIEGFRAFTYQKVKGATNKTIQGLVSKIPFSKNLANYQKKMIDTGAGGLNTLFWKTMSDKENKLGPLGEVDMAINRNLAGIVKDALVKLGLKGEPKNTKMTLIEQVANILSNNELSKAKMLEADRIVREEIDRKEAKEIEDAGDNAELVEIAEAKANGLRQAWDEAMSRQLDIPISDSTLRRLIFSKLKDDKSSIRELADAIVNDKTIGGARKERLLTSIIQQLDGLTKEGDTKRDYTKLREALSAQLDNMVEQSTLKRRANSALRKVAKEANPDGQAERQIERLAEIQSDVQSWPKAREDKVRDIVREDLKQKLDLGLKVREKIKAAWKGVLRQKLIDAGVKPDTAERLTDIVWRQHEINYLNRKMKDVEMAVTRGSIAPIVNAIKNTPLSQQQDPKWKRNVAFDFLKNAGLDDQTAGRIADLMDLTLQKVFVRAQEKAFNDIVSKQLKTEGSRRQLQRFLQAIRAGALDPTKNLTSEIAAQNGWTGFTSEQVARLNELDTIINDPDALDLQRSKAYKEINDIIKTSKLDPNVKDVLSAYYTAQALSGIPTTTVNIFSAVGFSMRNAMTDTMRLAATNPSALPAVFDTFVSSWKTYASEVLFSFKNNIQRRGTVEYLSNDDALLRLYNKGKRQWNEGKRAEGFKNMMFGMMEYVGRWLKALDEGAVSVLEQQGLTRYAMMAMKQAGISSKDATAAANYVQSQKEQFIINAIAKGMSKTEAKALSDDVFRGAWIEALSKLKIDSQEVLDASLNDALSSIGRINNTFDQLRQEERNVRDAGFVSSLPIGLLERLGEAMNSPNATEGQRIFYRMAYGFAIVPARVMREAAWFSPYGFVRFGLDAFAKARGKTSPYAQSLGTDLQYRQRLTEAIAGSIVLGALFALSKSSVDDPEDESLFKIVVTGNGPERRLDPQFYDAYFKKYSRNALHVFIGKTKFKVNIERGFEAFAIPFMLAGAIDDWKIRKRFEESKKTPSDLSDASILLGSAFLSFSRRGPFAAYMDGIVSSRNSDDALSSLGSFLTFTLKTFVPVAGTSLARNVSDFVSDPVERRSMEGALWANTPVIGPMMGTKSMNAIGETTGAGELSDRIYKLGMPIVFNIPNTPEQTKLRDLIIEKGQGPDIPTRYDARRTLGFELTDKQFEKYVTTYGQYMKKRMLESYPSLKSKSPVKYVETLQKYQETARTKAKTAVSQMQP